MNSISLLQIIFFIALFLVISTSDDKIGNGEKKNLGFVEHWPEFDQFGQISAVDVDKAGNVYVFHRGDRQWDSSSFWNDNVFRDRDKGPIPGATIIILDSGRGTLLGKTGDNLFYLPHGLTLDEEDNLWVTDVALHQVFKFPAVSLRKEGVQLGRALISLGVQFEPGSDRNHFCKPTGVAVDKETQEFYVSDGYCNSRLIKYDPRGNHLMSIGRSSVGFHRDGYMLNVPHALSLGQPQKTLYVADRENGRILSYDFESGTFKRSYGEELRSRIFSVTYSPLEGGLVFALTNGPGDPKMVAVYGAESGKRILRFSPKINFTNPHDLAVSRDGEYCYVVELNPFKAWKLKLDFKRNLSPSHVPGIVNESLPAKSKMDKLNGFEAGSSSLAVGLIVSIVAVGFLVFMLHYYSKKGNFARHEARRLILDDSENGIRLS